MAVVTASIIGGVALVGMGASVYKSNQAKGMQDDANALAQGNMDQQNAILREQLAFQKKQEAALNKQKDIYRSMEFENPYAGVENAYADLQTDFQNVYEDLTINQQQAQFEAQQGQQQRSNIMQGLKGAAGGSGIAGLAQAMANQGQQSAQRASASIGQQESANQRMSAQNAGRIQEMKAKGATDAEIARATGAQGADAASMQAELAKAQGGQAAQALGSQAELAQAGGMQQGQIAMGQSAMEAQKFRLQGLADSRNLQLQQSQGMLSFLSGQQAGMEANRQSDTAYKRNKKKDYDTPYGG